MTKSIQFEHKGEEVKLFRVSGERPMIVMPSTESPDDIRKLTTSFSWSVIFCRGKLMMAMKYILITMVFVLSSWAFFVVVAAAPVSRDKMEVEVAFEIIAHMKWLLPVLAL